MVTRFACLLLFALALLNRHSGAQSTAAVVKVPPNTNWCLGCICEAISNCNRTLKCEGDVCGLFRITWAYWADAGKLTVNKEDPNSQTAYSNCANNEQCAGTTVSNYLGRFAQDCNGDGVVDCNDYAAIHLFGGYGCAKPYSGNYFDKFNACQKQVQSLGTGSHS